MSRLTILDEIQIASPCDAEWSVMPGDDRTRFCGSCSKHVYNIVALTAEEATSLIAGTEGPLCLRLHRRADGTVITADCPVGLEMISKGQRVRRTLAMALIPLAFGYAALFSFPRGNPELPSCPTGPTVTWNDRLDWALSVLGISRKFTSVTSGTISGS